MNYIELGGGDF